MVKATRILGEDGPTPNGWIFAMGRFLQLGQWNLILGSYA